jgi:hypothetical protein
VNLRSRGTIATLALAIAGLALPVAGAATQAGGRANDASDVVSRYVANVIRTSPAAAARQTTLASSDGFDWSVALIGAGVALAVVLLLSATGIGVVRHRHSHLKSA